MKIESLNAFRRVVFTKVTTIATAVLFGGTAVLAAPVSSAVAEQCGIFDLSVAPDGLSIRAKASNGVEATILSYLSGDTEVTSALFSSPEDPQVETKFALKNLQFSDLFISYSPSTLADCASTCSSDDDSCACSPQTSSGNLAGAVGADGSRDLLVVMPDAESSWLRVVRGADTVVTCGTSRSEEGVPVLALEAGMFVHPDFSDPSVCSDTAMCAAPSLIIYASDIAYTGGNEGAVDSTAVQSTNRKVVRLLQSAIRTKSVKARRNALSKALQRLQRLVTSSHLLHTRAQRSVKTNIRLIRKAQRGGKTSTATIALAIRRMQELPVS